MANQMTPFRGGGMDPFMSLHREMNRMFDDVFRNLGVPAAMGRQEQGGGMLSPSIDVSETDKEIKICAELPGVTEKDVEVTLDGDVLTIRAEKRQERKADEESWHVVERSYGTFQRSLRLPFEIRPDQIQASFDKGLLNITLPKGEETQRRRRIPIQGSGLQSREIEGKRAEGAGAMPQGQPQPEMGRPQDSESPRTATQGNGAHGSGQPAGDHI